MACPERGNDPILGHRIYPGEQLVSGTKWIDTQELQNIIRNPFWDPGPGDAVWICKSSPGDIAATNSKRPPQPIGRSIGSKCQRLGNHHQTLRGRNVSGVRICFLITTKEKELVLFDWSTDGEAPFQ